MPQGEHPLPPEASTGQARIHAEIAHVLFIDLVGYSLLSQEGQARITSELLELVRHTSEFRRAELAGELVCGDSGDGMSLSFFRDPLAPVQCATEIARAVSAHSQLRLRMGIHSGPVTRGPDIHGGIKVNGSGVWMAQRVMDCGDAGHILVSERVASDLSEFETWANCLHDLGIAAVKNDLQIRIFNLIQGDIGNPAVPRRVQSVAERPVVAESPFSVPSTVTNPRFNIEKTAEQRDIGKEKRVVLLYKRRDSNSERLLNIIEPYLKKQGFSVFVDRHLNMGEEWIKEIASQIRRADTVVALISEDAVQSEMLEFEIRQATEAAQKQGSPRILPIRIAYDQELSGQLGGMLNHLQYKLWESEADDARVLADLLEALTAPPPVYVPLRRGPVGGAVPLDSEFYVVRPTDIEFREAIAQQESIVLVKGGRQMGKTSLLARGLQQARESGAKVVFTDFQSLSSEHFTSADALYRELANMIADQLDLDVLPEDAWSKQRGANAIFERYIRREVLGSFDKPMVWGLDEVDRLFTCPFGSEVFGLFRSWYNRRALDPTGPWSRLTLSIAYATEAHLFITDMNQSPFNVGKRFSLSDFNELEVSDLNQRYGMPLRTTSDFNRFHALIGGHPYLTCRGLDEMVARKMDIKTFEERAQEESGLYDDHLRRLLFSLSQDTIVGPTVIASGHQRVEAMRAVLRGDPMPSAESFYMLRGAGLVIGDSAQNAKPRCQLYKQYLSRHLL